MNDADSVKKTAFVSLRVFVVLMVITGLVAGAMAFGVTGLLVTVFQRQQEARNPFMRVVEITDDTVDSVVWGMNFPMQYDQYKRTVDMVRTRYGGSEAIPHTPSSSDPRSETARSKIEMNPRLKRMWAGYAFSIDYREARGHAYMLEDQSLTERHKVQQYGNCINCHGSMYTVYKELGDGDIQAGFEKVNPMTYQEIQKLVDHPVGCIDCHDPETMQLRVTRPAFIQGIRDAKAAEGIEDYDVNTMATRQEMRTFVCGQCHVEYYFSKDESRRLTFPWHKGFRGDQILAYYEEIGFKDWVHKETGTKMLKAQHPEFEMWNEGPHGRAGVTCADCHMPYMRNGALKISDHHVQSPLLNINNACQTCHKVPEEELLARVDRIQGRTAEMQDLALEGIVELIDAIVAAQASELPVEQIEKAQQCQRSATFLFDLVEAENSTGFHAPQEAARLLFKSMDYLRKGQKALDGTSVEEEQNPVEVPAMETPNSV